MAELSREMTASETRTTAQTAPSPFRRFIPERWYAHLVLWIACAFIGFP